MHYERAPRFRRSKLDEAPPPLRYAVQGFAPLRRRYGGFAIHSADPNVQPIEGATHEEIESHFAEKLIAFVGKHFIPELSQALVAQGSGDIKVFVNRKTGFNVNAGSHTLRLGIARDLPPAVSIQTDDATIEGAKLGDTRTANASFGSVGQRWRRDGQLTNHSRDE